MNDQDEGEKGTVGDLTNKQSPSKNSAADLQPGNILGADGFKKVDYQQHLAAGYQASEGTPINLDTDTTVGAKNQSTAKPLTGIDSGSNIPPSADRAAQIKPADAKGTSGLDQIPVAKQPEGKVLNAPSAIEAKALPTVSATEKAPQVGQPPSTAKLAGSDVNQSQAVFAARTQGAQSGDTGVSPAPGKSPHDAASAKATTDSPGVNKVAPASAEQQGTQIKSVLPNQVERSAPGSVLEPPKVEPSKPAVGAASLPPAHSEDALSVNAGAKQDVKPEVRPAVPQGSISTPENQFKSGLVKADSTPVAQPGVQPKVEPQKLEQPGFGQQKVDQNRIEPAKGSDYISTAGAQGSVPKQDAVKPADAKFDSGRPAEQAGSKEPAALKDPKAAGVLNETFGLKTESSPSQNTGGMHNADTGAKADQITKDIQGRVNEGAKQPSTDTRVPTSETSAGSKQPGQIDGKQPSPTDVKQPSQGDVRQPNQADIRQPSGAESTSGGRQPGIEGGGKSQGTSDGSSSGVKSGGTTNGAGVTGKQPGASDSSAPTARQPLHEAGDKPSGSGGGGGITSESTKKIDISSPSGGKADRQAGAGGMGGGGSAPVDRAPHKPFSVEDAQSSKGDSVTGKGEVGGKGEAGMKGDASAGGKGTAGAGPRFDTGEVRGNEPGARFDTGELKDGRRGAQPGGAKAGDIAGVKGGDSGIVKGTEVENVKGTDVPGIKASSTGGQGVGGSSGSDGGILSDKRQPSMLPDGLVQGGKPGKVGDGSSGSVGHAGGDDSVPFILPGALAGKGNQPVAGKGDAATGKGDATAGKGDAVMPMKGDTVVSGKTDAVIPGKGESALPGEKNDQSKDIKDKGHKADAGVAAGLAGPVGTGAADVGSVLKNFAQAVLADGKSGAQTGEGGKDSKAASSPMSADGKESPVGRQDFAGPGQKTRILDNQTPTGSDTKIMGATPGVPGMPIDSKVAGTPGGTADSKIIGVPGAPAGPGTPIDSTAARGPIASSVSGTEWTGEGDGGKDPVEEFDLPQVDLLGDEVKRADDADESDKVEEADESLETKLEDEMQYELARGLQLYTTIAEANYGAYHYLTKEGDTVEGVARDVVGDARCAPLVFSLNKEHILASTEYGVHPFKVGVMVQLPTPRALKEFFGGQ